MMELFTDDKETIGGCCLAKIKVAGESQEFGDKETFRGLIISETEQLTCPASIS